MMNPDSARVLQPAEWDLHSAVWTAWPSHAPYWEGHIEAARKDVAGLVKAIAQPVPGRPAPELVHLWVDGEEALQSAREALGDAQVDLIPEPFGDIWFRDIAPIFVKRPDGSLEYRTFRYNGWGGKYLMENDETVAPRIAKSTGLNGLAVDMVFEGGGLDVDGTGLGLTTASCLLNP
ncbi:MAG TPA: agmatine deiminase family protein, partial [Oceanipulchritudo sp.]|nr:agmatine deiminase family protein [Oceanipulchritudo sp.]